MSKNRTSGSDGKGNLVIGRKAGQSVEIGDGEIVVFVEKVVGSRVQLAIRADRKIKIMRSEALKRDGNSVR
jgi:sRNA-binding carbon storage regulator CsrA